MFILDACNNISSLGIINFIKNMLSILCIITPVLLLLILTIEFVKAAIASDTETMDKIKKSAVKRIIFAILVFLVPTIVNGVMGLLVNFNSFADCYNLANSDNVNKYAEIYRLEREEQKTNNEMKKKELQKKQQELYKKIQKNRNKKISKKSSNSNSGSSSAKGYYSNVIATKYKKASGIAEATGGESGLDNNEAGDQTGREVDTGGYRSDGWILLARPKNPTTAEIIARCMEDCAKNDHIGYDQSDRTTLYEEAKKKNWNIPSITKNVETTCSSVTSVCINAAGISFPKLIYADYDPMMSDELKKRKQYFEIITDSSKMSSTKDVRRGDILCSSGHTAVAI
jgi:hypothetical protein